MRCAADHSLVAINSRNVMEPLRKFIAQHPLADGLSREQISILAECATCVSFDAGQLIFSEGESAQNCFLIQSGKVALELNLGEERARIDVIGAGGALGWAWMFPPFYWHFDARALEPTRVICFYGKRLRDECERDHVLGYRLANHMTELVINRLQKTRLLLLKMPKAAKSFSVVAPN